MGHRVFAAISALIFIASRRSAATKRQRWGKTTKPIACQRSLTSKKIRLMVRFLAGCP